MKKTLMTALYSYTVLFSAIALTHVGAPHEKEFIESLEQWFMVPEGLTKALYNAAKPLHNN